ncbi:MAG: ABC transporter permease [Verrucomicrobiota bacterium]|nr:ABC transporter permease [Verrucomicrobiota bacterium]
MELIIERGRTERQYWRDLWRFRELLYFLAWRDILVRYKQTAIGIAWSLLRPLVTMLVFTFVFGRLAKLPSDGVPYPLLVFSGLLPWSFFSTAISESGNSLVTNSNLISKIYFPRMVVPISSIVTCFVDFLIAGALLVGVMIYYQHPASWRLLALPGLLFLCFLAGIGAGLWLSALTVKYRDFRFIIPFIVQFGLYISPVGFSSTRIPDDWRMVYALNPIVGVIDGFRWAIVGGNNLIHLPSFLVSFMVIIVLVVTGAMYFRHTEKSFADII